MSKEEYNFVRTELLISQQKNTYIHGELNSLRRNLCADKHIIQKMEGQLHEAKLKIDDLNWQIEGIYSPPPTYINPIPYHIIVREVEKNIVTIRCSLDSKISRSQLYHHFHHFHAFPAPHVDERDPLFFLGEQDSIDLFGEYHHLLDIINNLPLDPSNHL